MSLHSPDLRFGIFVDGRRSYTWRVRAGANQPELFVERENFPRVTHVSLHASGQWYVRATRKRDLHRWPRPNEIVPGYTRALAIVQPVVVAMLDLETPSGARLLRVGPESEPTTFSLFIERPGANMAGWPGKNAMGTAYVGRIPLAHGAGTCCVVAHQAPVSPFSATFPQPSEDELAQMRKTAAEGKLYGTIGGDMSDGPVCLVDGKFPADAFPEAA
ncbi:hypothetical protein [Phytohabitans aurantiacus]|jgi:hypothetical protein|uniref:Uncharacterized protein n=1 Tax=Phytohabitans aurantiacus TaxID=3016789 RepID=A0ABQ5RBN7_9ACTN|nr:hypothetical protein [Phytohabitans aurantiacus]GLI03805.1 hypothetical protein Pa4123_90850 [Phytohabitans aurantiacus]